MRVPIRMLQAEMLKEARLMADLKHRHIVRLIGTCKSGQTIMLVMELASLGPVNKYLKAHRFVCTSSLTFLKVILYAA